MNFMDQLENWKEVETKIKLIILAVLVGGVAIYWVFVDRVEYTDEIQAQEAKISSIQEEIESMKRLIAKIPEVEEQIKIQKIKLDFITSDLSREQAINKLIEEINTAGTRVGVEFARFTPAPNPDKKNNYDLLPITLSVKGSFASIIMFLDRITRSSRVIKVRKINVGSPQLVFSKMKVSAAITLETVIYRPNRKSSGGGSRKGKGRSRRGRGRG